MLEIAVQMAAMEFNRSMIMLPRDFLDGERYQHGNAWNEL